MFRKIDYDPGLLSFPKSLGDESLGIESRLNILIKERNDLLKFLEVKNSFDPEYENILNAINEVRELLKWQIEICWNVLDEINSYDYKQHIASSLAVAWITAGALLHIYELVYDLSVLQDWVPRFELRSEEWWKHPVLLIGLWSSLWLSRLNRVIKKLKIKKASCDKIRTNINILIDSVKIKADMDWLIWLEDKIDVLSNIDDAIYYIHKQLMQNKSIDNA